MYIYTSYLHTTYSCIYEVCKIMDYLKSLVPIDCKFHGQGKTMDLSNMNIYLNNTVVFANIQTSAYEKKIKENNKSTEKRKYIMFLGNT